MFHSSRSNLLRGASAILQSGLLGVRAEVDGDAAIIAAINGFKAEHTAELKEFEKEIAALNLKIAALRLNGPATPGDMPPPDLNYTNNFKAHMRRGDRAGPDIHAAMSTGSAADGGYLAPIEWDRTILQAQRAVSPMRRLAATVPSSTGAYVQVWDKNLWGSGWVGETAARPATTTTELAQVPFNAGEIYANPQITQQALDDVAFDLEKWLADSVSIEFDKQEGIAFISGNGTNKPFGLLQYIAGGAADGRHPGGNLTVVPSGHATLLGTDASAAIDTLINFMYGLPSPYRQNATWLMNSSTAAAITRLKDADGNLIWREALIAGQPTTLLGRPVEIDENMPNIGAGNLAIAFGNFAVGYLINDRIGTRVLRDAFTNKPYVGFYTTRRVGAGVRDPNAIRLLKIAAS